MAKKNLMVDIFQVLLIVIMSFFCISLTSSGKVLNDTLNAKSHHGEMSTITQNYPKTIIVKYKLINNDGDTIYIDRKLDSIEELQK